MNKNKQTQDWNKRYSTGNPPWETGRHDRNLENTLRLFSIAPGKAFEFGCGTANNAIWLAQNGFEVQAMDVSSTAVETASDKARKLALNIGCHIGNILNSSIPGAPFNLVFDRGCFHSLDTREEMTACSRIVHGILDANGHWISISGNADGPAREVGPPRLSALDIVSAVEEFFEIIMLKSGFMDSDHTDPPRAWICLMKRRHRVAAGAL